MTFARTGTVVSVPFGQIDIRLDALSNVVTDGCGNFLQELKIAQALERLQENQETETRSFTARDLFRQSHLLSCRRIDGEKITGRHHAFEARVRRFLKGGQGKTPFRGE